MPSGWHLSACASSSLISLPCGASDPTTHASVPTGVSSSLTSCWSLGPPRRNTIEGILAPIADRCSTEDHSGPRSYLLSDSQRARARSFHALFAKHKRCLEYLYIPPAYAIERLSDADATLLQRQQHRYTPKLPNHRPQELLFAATNEL